LSAEASIRLAAAWGGLLLFDLVIFVMTIVKAVMIGKSGSRSLLTVLLRDGSVYFLVMVCVTLLNILSFLLGVGYVRGMMTTFANIISSTMISRLMLNLRDASLALPAKRGRSSLTAADSPSYNPYVTTVMSPSSTTGGGDLDCGYRTTVDIELMPRAPIRTNVINYAGY